MTQATEAPRPPDESDRIGALLRYRILDSPSEQFLDDLAFLASEICGTPIALVSLVDSGAPVVQGPGQLRPVAETPREVAFCAHAIPGRRVFVVPDTRADRRFASNPMVVGEPRVRFYAGAPLVTSDGYALGTLCVMDKKPRQLTPDQTEALRALSPRSSRSSS